VQVLVHKRRVLRVPLTPLIDVVFILLLFFMLSSSFVRYRGIEFNAAAAGASESREEPQRVFLYEDGRVSLGETKWTVDSDAFREQLKQWRDEDVNVVVTPAAGTIIQTVVGLLDRIHVEGISRLNLSESFTP
jgi:biopolymer transport protein ExbD